MSKHLQFSGRCENVHSMHADQKVQIWTLVLTSHHHCLSNLWECRKGEAMHVHTVHSRRARTKVLQTKHKTKIHLDAMIISIKKNTISQNVIIVCYHDKLTNMFQAFQGFTHHTSCVYFSVHINRLQHSHCMCEVLCPRSDTQSIVRRTYFCSASHARPKLKTQYKHVLTIPIYALIKLNKT